MEFLVEVDVTIPDGTADSTIKDRENAEVSAAAGLRNEGHLVRLWKPSVAPGERKAVGLYEPDDELS